MITSQDISKCEIEKLNRSVNWYRVCWLINQFKVDNQESKVEICGKGKYGTLQFNGKVFRFNQYSVKEDVELALKNITHE
jgi:hypothetical protein